MHQKQIDSHAGGKELPAGTRLEEFLIERVLGSGGFGITYLARDTSLNRQVVIKENLPAQFAHRDTSSLTVHPGPGREDQENFQWSLENFSREAEMLASLHHPGIVPVLRRFETFGTAYFVMPFVEGAPFDTLIEERHRKNNPFSEDELRGLLERVLSALDHLHQRGIYHRDIKPGNILISNDGIPVLIDFGSARQRLSERSMTVIESAGYTPFEQLESRGNVGPWSDLYALGGTLEKALTGHTPPKANDRMRRDLRVPLAERPDLCTSFSSVFLHSIDKALQVEEADRWQDAGKWLEGLRKQSAVHTNTLEPAAVKFRPAEAVSWMPNDLGREPLASVSQTALTGDSKSKGNRAAWIVGGCVVLTLFAFAMSTSNKKTSSTDVLVAGDTVIQRDLTSSVEAEATSAKEEQERMAGEEKIRTEAEAAKKREELRLKEQEAATAEAPYTATKAKPFSNSLGMKYVPAASYENGKNALFCIWETRRKDYSAYSKSKLDVNRDWAVPGIDQEDDHPVVHVSWDDANAFCAWLTSQERSSGMIGPQDEYRLPTDAEWSLVVGLDDFSASGTPKAKDEKNLNLFPWGLSFPPPSRSGNFADQSAARHFNETFKVMESYRDGFPSTSPVGSFPANELGIHDLAGNVWEWCSDTYSTDETDKVARGGSWGSYSKQYLLSSHRSALPQHHRSRYHGFRCVLVTHQR